ncbi:hypothetical protein ORI89_06625 [Sphingobacterium sp. UT-1RO-CII-1]|uniref:hypothetical protein n=1 Tax=Sphingobacterium sp. UT-1RO-CII-1 TaxID=2995225 RepID=UPI00227A3110|nr:hypothetical protein [Sphingobacterium sp. UT-1RO-CII-1]MCY4779317.1 hypothetical protein [Sphingobacterium sp. UT-1RO-CII-1]
MTEIEKFYTFNQTGNILIITTEKSQYKIPLEVTNLFDEVSVFFSTMIKSISQTKKDDENSYYSINDYDAVSSILDGSGYLINTSKQELYYKIDDNSKDLGREIIGNVLGIDPSSSSLSFADGMLNSMKKDTLKNVINGDFHINPLKNRVSTIFFICEYLMGMTCISVMVLHFKLDESLKLNKTIPPESILSFKKTGALPSANMNQKVNFKKVIKIKEAVIDNSGSLVGEKNLLNKEEFVSLGKFIEVDTKELDNLNKGLFQSQILKSKDIESLNFVHFRKDTYNFISPKALSLYAKEYNVQKNNYDILKMKEEFISMIKNVESEKRIE